MQIGSGCLCVSHRENIIQAQRILHIEGLVGCRFIYTHSIGFWGSTYTSPKCGDKLRT